MNIKRERAASRRQSVFPGRPQTRVCSSTYISGVATKKNIYGAQGNICENCPSACGVPHYLWRGRETELSHKANSPGYPQVRGPGGDMHDSKGPA